jgi:hypothetical protein
MMKRPSASKTSKLEQTLDGLVTLLNSATQGAPGIANAVLSIHHPKPLYSQVMMVLLI